MKLRGMVDKEKDYVTKANENINCTKKAENVREAMWCVEKIQNGNIKEKLQHTISMIIGVNFTKEDGKKPG